MNMIDTREIPAPHIDEETQAYWDGASAGKLMVKKCRSCGSAHHYPRTICPHCGSDDTYYVESSGKGVIYSFSVMRRAQPNYAIAYVTVEDAEIKMMTNIVNCDFDALEIGQAVKVTFVETETAGVSVPMFEPA
ncbi:MAG: Zn-ribbon domain-containing OB-fold protein [Sneathiella sp.]|uniref:Zn-ribbon domain-containing OB-fold protein n=1 Tax=Sneathiella sp. TaxID=1964365 RepID=UPI003001D853